MVHKSLEAVEKQNSDIKAQLRYVTSLVEKYCEMSTVNAGKTTLKEEEQRLAKRNLFKYPLLQMGVFDALPRDGTSQTLDELARKLNADKTLLVRLMRMATNRGPFKEVGVEEYAHTEYSLIYLVPEIRGIFKLIVDEYQPAELRLFEFFQANGCINPTNDRNCPYTFVHQTEGKTMWEYLSQFPDRFQAFNYAMQAQSSAVSWSTKQIPLVIDIGGGKEHTISQIKELTGSVPGRFILQERQEVLDDIDKELAGIERQVYDFFTPQPVKGALIYYLRRVLHDWSDDTCVAILHNIAAGITDKAKQRVVISEFIPPEMGADVECAWSDITMMTLHGMERTEKQWKDLLEKAGYRLTRTFRGKGTSWGAMEAFLK
ncbi:O-methyltransferase, putative [Paecilomyces variotii No. 5]|uniref:O-methyltransferase, putative n=1 Tax=Byssochlamys spectabilis (strain No. 5 / NBRC 109023) TaxID=1356009 RepID=V5G6Y4_BYSSN|nr:O-methyltransferase, putative [Paecilomyces variotii No. 5]